MLCPACRKLKISLEPIELDSGLPAEQCPRCSGVWLTHARYEHWQNTIPAAPVETNPVAEPPAAGHLEVNDIPQAKLCPACGHFMLKYQVGRALAFHIDHCRACGGFWLDQHEWDQLKINGCHRELNRIVSATWQREIRADAAQQQLEQLYRDRLGAENFVRIEAFKQWLDAQPLRTLILGYLTGSDDGSNPPEPTE